MTGELPVEQTMPLVDVENGYTFPPLSAEEAEHNCPNTLSVQLAGEALTDPANAGFYPEGHAQAQTLRMLRARAIIEKARDRCKGPMENGVCPFGGPIWDALTLTHQDPDVLHPVNVPANKLTDRSDTPIQGNRNTTNDDGHNTGQYL
jgi:hypothetical protein